ncbi:retrovirus-related pol polyprotein from transposon TNT 1-94 [Tanacetum coccineum]
MNHVQKNTNVIAPGMFRMNTKSTTQTRTLLLPRDVRKTNKRVSFSTRVNSTTSVSRPQLKRNLEDRFLHNNSQVNTKEVEEHHRNFKFSNKKSVTTCNDSLNVKTLNVNFVCLTCGKCMVNENHDLCVVNYINGVNSRSKKPITVPIINRKPKRTVNQSIATPPKKIVASESTHQKPRGTLRKLYEYASKTCSWWYPKYTPSGYNWKPKSNTGNVTPNANNPVYSRLWVLKTHDGKSQAPKVYYVEGLNHNLFSVGQFCDADLEVAFQISTCYVRYLKGNDLLTATSSQAWLWHRRLSHLNFDSINLLSKNDIVIDLLKLKFVKDHLCSSCELGKAKRKYTWTHFLRSEDQTSSDSFKEDFMLNLKRMALLKDGNRNFVEATRKMPKRRPKLHYSSRLEAIATVFYQYFTKEGIEHQTSVA